MDPENILLALGKFDVYVCNRSTRGGGCAILCDPDKISSKLIANINGTGYELLVIDLYFPVNLRVFCVYRAPGCNSLSNSELFNHICNLWATNMVITGDFNFPDIDWQSYTASSGGYQILHFLQNFGLKQLVSEPTRYNKILDLVLTNCELINDCSVSEEFSDHLSVLFKIQSNKKSKKKFTNILSTDKKSLLQLDSFLISNFSVISTECYTLDDKYNKMIEIFNTGKNNLPTVKVKNLIYNPEIRTEIKIKLNLWKAQRGNQGLRPQYLDQVKKVNKLISNFNEAKFDKMLKNGKDIHTFLRKRLRPENTISPIELDGKTVLDDKSKVEIFSVLFQDYFNRATDDDNIWTPDFYIKPIPDNLCLHDIETDVGTVQKFIKDSSNKLNTSPDSVQFKFVKNCDVFFTSFASEIFRISLDTGQLPTYWRSTYIIPLYKNKGSKNDPKNYRPIALSCTLLKILESMISVKILQHFNKFKLFNKWQFGFLPKKSLNIQLIYQLEKWYASLCQGKGISSIYVDFAKASDSVNIKILL